MSDDPMADFLAREKAALGQLYSKNPSCELMTGDDAALFAGGSAPSAPSGLEGFEDFSGCQVHFTSHKIFLWIGV